MRKDMLCLGIEGTAHTIGAAVVRKDGPGKGTVLSNVTAMYVPEEGGIHPREAANHHSEKAVPVILEALEKAGIGIEELSLVAFSQGPGLGPCLRTGATAARAIALSADVPLVGVNHCIAHLEVGRMATDCIDPVLLYVSGGNTQVIAFSKGRYRVLGETMDIGIGNMLDKFGRERGMPFPAGPRLEEAAARAEAAGRPLLPLPYSVKGMDVAFSGILTAAEHASKGGAPVDELAYALQETCFAMLTEVTERAMAYTRKDEVLLGGGVARNSRLQAMVDTMARERRARMFVPPPGLLVDNGAMIAWTGIIMHEAGVRLAIEDSVVMQRFRTDDVEVTWR